MQGNNAAAITPGRLIRRLEPRTRLALLLMSFVMVLLPRRPAAVVLGAAAVLLHLTLTRTSPKISIFNG
jgi:energy-coupling factor transporter transmembrane protein EcfT